MSKKTPCKRFWEGSIGIVLTPRKQKSGEAFWTFSFVRAFKRKGSEKWEYTQHYGQKHAEALGRVMSKALQFMEQYDATQFAHECEAASAADVDVPLDDLQLPSIPEAATH